MSTPRAPSRKHLPHKLKMAVKKQLRLLLVSDFTGPQADFTVAAWRAETVRNGIGRPRVAA